MIKSFLDLEIYKESFQLNLEVEEELKNYPEFEKYLLVDQTRRSSRAVPALIAEGYGKRETPPVFKKMLRDAIGESNETINHLALAKAKGYIEAKKADDLISRYHITGKKISKLKDKWQKY